MVKKVLFCATIDAHFESFHLPYFKWFKDQGWEVHIAANGDIKLPYVDQRFVIPLQRSPFKLKNLNSFIHLKNIVERNNYQIIHGHTPMGGVISRLVGSRARKKGTKVLYTAHGFHFYKGAPAQNWILYYPIEKLLNKYTDCLITINNEDYQFAKKYFKTNRIEHVFGVGVNTEIFRPVDSVRKIQLKQKLGFKAENFLLFYAAEFNQNKNQKYLIQMIAYIKEQVPHVKLLLAGEGELFAECKKLAKQLRVEKEVIFLGHRSDIASILSACDVTVASSLREGLPVNIMEAMACGLPVVATENRGHRELIENNKNGWVVDQSHFQEMGEKIKLLENDPELMFKLGRYGRKMMEERYSIAKVLEQKSKIYQKFMSETEVERWLAQ